MACLGSSARSEPWTEPRVLDRHFYVVDNHAADEDDDAIARAFAGQRDVTVVRSAVDYDHPGCTFVPRDRREAQAVWDRRDHPPRADGKAGA